MKVLYSLFVLWWKDNPLRAKVCLFVLSFHLLGFYYLTKEIVPSRPKRSAPLLVKTVRPAPPTELRTAQASRPTAAPVPRAVPKAKKLPAKEKPKEKPAPPAPKKSSAPPKSPHKESTTPRPANKKKQQQKAVQESLQKIEKSITQIEKNHDTLQPQPEWSVPTPPPLLPDFSFLGEERDYASSLGEYLQEHLRLPEMGEVKMQLTLYADGRVETLKVLSSESAKNRKKLEEVLPLLRFPIPPKENRTFILTFCNEL